MDGRNPYLLDAHCSASDLTGDESRASPGRLVVEEDTVAAGKKTEVRVLRSAAISKKVARIDVVRLAVVNHNPVGKLLSDGIRRAGVEGRRLSLGGFPDL